MPLRVIRFGFCIQRPNGQLWDATFATSQRKAWWQFVLHQPKGKRPKWVDKTRADDYCPAERLGLGPTFHDTAAMYGWMCVRVRRLVEEVEMGA